MLSTAAGAGSETGVGAGIGSGRKVGGAFVGAIGASSTAGTGGAWARPRERSESRPTAHMRVAYFGEATIAI